MDIVNLLLLSLAVTYLTHVLLLEQKISHYGPFVDKDRLVEWRANPDKEIAPHVQSVTLFDWIRRPFGVYTVKGHVWIVNETASERWTCPICLSFWVAAAMLVVHFVLPPDVFQQILLLLALSAFSSIVNVNLL